MSPEMIGLFGQIPLVGAVIWFALAMIKAQTAASVAAQERSLEHERTQQIAAHAFFENQNAQWRELLRIQSQRRKEAMAEGIEKVNVISDAIANLADVVSLQTKAIERHDEEAQERHEKVMSELRKN